MPSQRVAVAVLLSNFCEFAGSQSVQFGEPEEVQSLIKSLSFEESLEFKALAAAKEKKCGATAFPCGKSCQPAKNKNGTPRKCRNPLEGQAATYQDWLKDKSAIVLAGSSELSGKNTATQPPPKVQKKSSGQAAIDEKYASSKPDEDAIDGWEKESLAYHTSPEGLALSGLTWKYHGTPGGLAWEDGPDYVKEIADKESLISATLRKEQENAKQGLAKLSDWKNYSLYTDVERSKMEKKIASPKTSEKERQKLRNKIDEDRTRAEGVAKRQAERYSKSPEERRAELEAEFDAVAKAKTEESKQIQQDIANGDVNTIQSEMDRVLRPLSSYRDDSDDENILDTRKRQRDIIREHLIERSKQEKPESVLGVGSDFNAEQLKAAYRKAALSAHPDKGGTREEFQKVNEAYQKLLRNLEFSEEELIALSEYFEVVECEIRES